MLRDDRPRRLLPMACAIYGLLFGLALLLADESLFYASADAARRGVDPLRDPAAGVLAGGIAVALSRVLTRRTRWGHDLASALGALLGRLSMLECLVLAGISGIAEEALFRGALQPRIGWLAASLLFGLAHLAPRRDLRAWTLFALAAGLAFGALWEATGNLVAPVVAHTLINAVNLPFLSRHFAPAGPAGPRDQAS